MNDIEKIIISALLIPSLQGPGIRAAEFEVLDRFSVDGYTVLKGSADIPGGSFTVGGSTLVVKNGNVGIGTTNPSAQMETQVAGIAGANADALALTARAVFPGGPTLDTTVGFNFNLGQGTANAYTYAAIRAGEDSGQGAIQGALRFLTQAYSGGPVLNERMRISSAGNVGIGTTNPVSQLQINGTNSDIFVNSTSGAQASISFQHNAGASYLARVGTYTRGSNDVGLAFSVGGNGITSPAVYIKQNGDVGIGTAGPAAGYKLDAAGAGGTGIRITDISNTSSLRFQWADSTGTITAAKDGAIATAINFNTQTAAGATTGTLSLNAGNVGIGTTNPVANLDVSGTGSIKIPVGSTAERPSAPANGMMRMNTTTGKLEYYYNLGWNSIGAVAATGGTINDGVTGYRIHTFTASEAITFTTGGTVEVLVVAGGGGGRGDRGAGGGAGGLIYQSAFTVAPQTYSVTVGAGGAGGVGVNAYPGVNGGNSIFSTLTAVGGGYGGRYGENNGASGGSGGGGAGLGTSGQGRDGGSGNGSAPGGGGGAGGAGQSAPNTTTGGNGGVGLAYSISGSSVYYSGGGGAGRGMDTGTSRGLGGLGGGGDGGNAGGAAGAAGAANTGGGGGGGANIPQGDGGIGGSGIVIIRYPN